MTAVCGDGNDVEEVLNVSRGAIEKARAGVGPQFLEFRTYRWREHCGPDFDDHLNYRSLQEIESGMSDCPIVRYRAKLGLDNKDAEAEFAAMETEIRKEIGVAFEFALSSRKPTSDDAREKVYA
jgi:pyruvate dehydrogenase E1 component alpha subunit